MPVVLAFAAFGIAGARWRDAPASRLAVAALLAAALAVRPGGSAAARRAS
jgi:hypothetical protein